MAKAYQTFEARGFHPGVGNEALEGEVFFSIAAVTFQSGDTILEIPLHRVLAEFDEAGEGRVVLRDAHQPDWTIITADLEVLECRSVPQIARLAETVTQRLTRREVSRRIKIVLGFCAVCGLALWMGMVALGAMVRSIVVRVPAEVEKQFGNGLMDELRREYEFAKDTNESARLALLAEPLLRAVAANQSWQFHIVEEDSPNAFALPGGHIVLTRGLLQISTRDEELLGVVAHEMAHVMHKHSFRQQISSAGPFVVLQIFLGGSGGGMAAVAGGSALLIHQSFSQEYEKQADDEGWRYLLSANIDPRGMTDMFRKLKASEDKEEQSVMPKAFHSHPDMDKRIARLEKKWNRLRRKSGFRDLQSDLQLER